MSYSWIHIWPYVLFNIFGPHERKTKLTSGVTYFQLTSKSRPTGGVQLSASAKWLETPERGGLRVTRWLTESSAYQPWQCIMVSHRAVDQFNSWDSSVTWFCYVIRGRCWEMGLSMGYHHRLSGFICRTKNQPPSYKENMANRHRQTPKTGNESYCSLLHSAIHWHYQIYYILASSSLIGDI